MILCRFKIKDFLKLPYLIWLIVFLAFSYPIYKYFAPDTDYKFQTITAVINVGLYGTILIRMISYLLIEKAVSFKKLSIVFWLWLVFLLLCILSKNEAIWPIWYFVMFGSLYLTSFSEKDRLLLTRAISDGLIVFFFWVQIRAFLYRPYDTGARYYGHFTNPNVNGGFYLFCMAGFLTKSWIMTHSAFVKKNTLFSKITKVLFFLLTISLFDFAFYTGSRSAFLGVSFMTLMYLLTEMISSKYRNIVKIKQFLAKGLLIFICFIILLYPVYACARYIPALRHHPVWYRDYSEYKVHSWDPIDSPKYTTFENAVGSGMISYLRRLLTNHSSSGINSICLFFTFDHMPLINVILNTAIPSESIDYYGGTYVLEYEDGVMPGTDENHLAYIFGVDENGKTIGYSQMPFPNERRVIWKNVIQRLNLWGHSELYPEFYVGQRIGHAHNSFLQISYCFGIITGVIFSLIIVWGIKISFMKALEYSQFEYDTLVESEICSLSASYVLPMVYLSGFFVSGLFECNVFTGQFLFSGLFMVVGLLVWRNS